MQKLAFICKTGLVALAMVFSTTVARAEINIEKNFDSIFKIAKSEISFSETGDRGCKYVTCLGEILNLTDNVWQDLVVEVNYFNAAGDLIDTETERLYSHVLRSNDSTTFKIRTQANQEFAEYSSHAARITWA